MKRVFCFFIGLIASLSLLFAQIITTTPAFPLADQPVTIIYDATLGTGGLKGYTGEMYAHTGVITSTSNGSWKYAPTWGNNADKYKMTSLGNDKWSLSISPSIKSYYGANDSETIQKMAFVFRSKDNSKEGKDIGGKDIFVDVYLSALSVRFDQPSVTTFSKGTTTQIQATASSASAMKLYANGVQIANSASATTISTNYTFNTVGSVEFKATVTSGTSTEEATMVVTVIDNTVSQTRPAGTRPGINYTSDTEATLVLQAPGKKTAYVIGDFNDWKYNANHQMKQDGEYFWITISGLTKGEEYAFQYVVDQTITVADPYTEKVLDPWNDSYITNAIYPNLKAYPTDKAEGIVSVLQTGQQPYQWQVTNFEKPDKEQLIIYEMLIRDFTTQKSYAAAIEKLPYLKTLGVNAIELMPVNEFEGNSSWGYNPSFYFAPDKAYGTKNDLKAFVDACHANGMAVILDLVLNHSFGQSPFYLLYRDSDGRPSADNPWYNQDSNIANPSLQWGYDFNHESSYTKALVDSVAGFWINEYKMDGFRYDFTKGFSNTTYGESSWADGPDNARITILKRMAAEVKKRDANAYIIFEHLAAASEEKQLADAGIMLWKNANHAYCQSGMGFYSESGFNHVYAGTASMPAGSLVSYMESHDEERVTYKMQAFGNGTIKTSLATRMSQLGVNAAFFLTVPGPKMIWQFGEVGYDVSIDYNGRTGEKPVRWYYADASTRKTLYDTYSNLLALRHSYPELFSSDATFSWRATESYWANGRFITCSHGNNAFVVVGNFTNSSGNFSTTFPKTGTWYEYMNEDNTLSVNSISQAQSIDVPANSYKLYTNFKPVITGIKDNMLDDEVVAYFNSATDELIIDGEAKMVEVYSMNGMLAKQEINCSTVNFSVLQPGIYLAKVTMTDGRVQTCKVFR